MAAEPYSLELSVTLPPDTGQPADSRVYTYSAQFSHKVEHKLQLTGSGTHVVGFGTIASPGAKFVLIEYENNAPSQAAIQVNVNGGADDIELSPGAALLISNPSPAVGITALSLSYTSAGTVRVTLLA